MPMKPIIIFNRNLQFLYKEQKTSVNIKDRQNRKNVEKALSKLIEFLKSAAKTGMYCFFGFERSGEFISEAIECPKVSFEYHCGSRFDSSILDKCKSSLNNVRTNQYLLLVSGEDSYLFDNDFK